MYRQIVAADFRKHFDLPVNYKIAGFLCHGTWKREDEIENLKKVLKELKLDFKIKPLSGFLQRMVEFEIEGKKYWFDIPYGGAMLSEFLHVACLFGSQKNILIGTCGGLSTQIESCDCIVPTWTYGDESSTRLYSEDVKDNHHFPDKNLSATLKNIIPKDIKIWEGPTVTCQAMLGESLENVMSWSKEGYLGVEMEASTVFAVSNHFNIPSAALLVVGDNLIKEETVLHENYQKQSEHRYEVRREILKVAVEELISSF